MQVIVLPDEIKIGAKNLPGRKPGTECYIPNGEICLPGSIMSHIQTSFFCDFNGNWAWEDRSDNK